MKARALLVIVLAAMLALVALPYRQRARAVAPGNARAARATTATAGAAPLPEGFSFLSDELAEQTAYKFDQQRRLRSLSTAPGTRLGQAPDAGQASIGTLVERGTLHLILGARAAFAYVQPYREPDLWDYRNYCAAGAAIILFSHWDASYPHAADIDELGSEIQIDADYGAWISDVLDPVNRRVNRYLGEDLNWYRLGHAQSLRQFRWMLNLDIMQNSMPLITGVMTADLPGWGSLNVGHIVAVYGYIQMPDGSEWVAYADTAAPASGYDNYTLHVWELNDFWRAVSENSAQVW